MAAHLTIAFYKFVDLPDAASLRAPLLSCCERLGLKGLILLATEGINGTVAGPPEGVHGLLTELRQDPRLADLPYKKSWSQRPPFHRMKVRVKKEIVTLGIAGLRPSEQAGTYVKPQDWNALISDPEVLVIDTRNRYEVEIGTFAGAIDPGIDSFSELPQWLDHNPALQPEPGRKARVAMFCTGGIRCEKSTSLLRARGFEEVYHLDGGILKYLEEIPEDQSLWQGQCFVFDERVSVGHGLQVGPHGLCRACRQPLLAEHRNSPAYVPGVSCPRCVDQTSEAQKDSARERQRQWELARQRRQAHIGVRLPAP